MKHLLFLVFLASTFILPCHAAGGIPARDALRTLGRVRGASWLDRVIQINGDRGTDQPATWHIIANDGKGGLREFFVNAKAIISEGPVPADVVAAIKGPAVDAKSYVKDSTHAFVAANETAKRVRLGFDSANFRLRCAPNTKTPVWSLELLDANALKLADVTVSAVSGKVLNTVLYPQPVPPPQAPTQTRQNMDKAREVVNNGVKGVGRGLQRAGSWIQRQFTPQPPQ